MSLWKNFPSVSKILIVFFNKSTEEGRIAIRNDGIYKHKLGNIYIPCILFLHVHACLYVSGLTCKGAYACMCRQNLTSGIFISLHFIEVNSMVKPVTLWCCLAQLFTVPQGCLSLPQLFWGYRIYKWWWPSKLHVSHFCRRPFIQWIVPSMLIVLRPTFESLTHCSSWSLLTKKGFHFSLARV